MSDALERLLRQQVARFTERRGDWDAFADARVEGFRRAQHRFIGSGASGKADASVVPAQHFTLSVMFVPPGQGNAAHTHEVEEVFFILEGKVLVFIEDGAGGRAETVLGPWDCISCPANVIHGFQNVGLEGAYLHGQALTHDLEAVGILAAWGIAGYVVAAKRFGWQPRER